MTILRNNAVGHCVGVTGSFGWPRENDGGAGNIDSCDRERLTFSVRDTEIYEIWEQIFREHQGDLRRRSGELGAIARVTGHQGRVRRGRCHATKYESGHDQCQKAE